MKQMKFFLVALMAVVMGMSVTSCMNGDDNTPVSYTHLDVYKRQTLVFEVELLGVA